MEPSTPQPGPMLRGCDLAIFEATNREAFAAALVRFAHHLEFSTISATVVIDTAHAGSQFITVDNTSQAYLHLFHDTQLMKRSPVGRHCKANSIPIAWDRSTYANAGLIEDWELQSPYGYGSGVAVAVHAPRGRHLMLGVDRGQPLPKSHSERLHLMASLQLFVAHAQDAAMRVLLPADAWGKDPVHLSARELECLRWTMEGKTAWEVGRILGVAEQTAVRHLYNATRKLECSGKHHAVIRALRLGLIW